MSPRAERLKPEATPTELAGFRSPFQKDRDRILYSKAFRRLNGVSQVVSASEGATYHNRMIHSLKVAQVGRRLAESLVAIHKELEEFVNPDVVESAALAHDLGHPPFGHIGERALRDIAREWQLKDGFEGNAQNTRILTRLETSPYEAGLNLTRATLQAVAKYPRSYEDAQKFVDEKAREKFGFYQTEVDAWRWIDQPSLGGVQCAECQLMEWADDVSYAIHDLIDFYRIGLIPLEHFRDSQSFVARQFIEATAKEFKVDEKEITAVVKQHFGLPRGSIIAPYQGFRDERQNLYRLTNNTLTDFLDPERITVDESSGPPRLVFDPAITLAIKVLKHLTVHYVIKSYALNSIQTGQYRALITLAEVFREGVSDEKKRARIPNVFKDLLDEVKGDEEEEKRLTIDMVAGLSDQQAHDLYCRISGANPGSIRNPII